MKTLILAAALAAIAFHAEAATISRTYSYFTIGGVTVEEIERELKQRGPQVNSTGLRHPGATRMEFTSRVSYAGRDGRCGVGKADVTVRADMILPRWNQRKKASPQTRLIWDTLSADIRRHEESHIVIARNHARELEDAIRQVQGQHDCTVAAEKVQAITSDILARHNSEQDRFDHIEGRNFESRLLRLLQYRIERIEDGRLASP